MGSLAGAIEILSQHARMTLHEVGPGARRPVLLRISEPAFSEEAGTDAGTRAVRLRFTLPAGSYATVVVAAVTEETC